jgi:tetratricopeptide (TPR) repeat protein
MPFQVESTQIRQGRCLLVKVRDETDANGGMKVQSPESKIQSPKAVRPAVLCWVVAGAVVVLLIALLWHARRGAFSTIHSAAAGGGTRAHSDVIGAGTKAGQRFHFTSARSRPEKSAEAIVAEKVQQFGRSRRAIAERIAKRRKEDLPPEIDAFFKAIDKGDWEEISSRWKELATHTHQYEGSKDDRPDLEPYWQSVLDAYGAAEQAHMWPAQRLLDYGNAVLDSLRPGMVYVGGTDNGRWIPELLNETSGDPHVMITQNALADNTYLEYLGELYGGQFNVLSKDDSSRAFADYTADAQKRYQHDLDFPNEPKQVLPGENVTMVDGKFQISGQIAVMAINERILQMMVAQNPDASFALQESFPLRDTYANALPLGPLMELNAPNDQTPFTADVAEQSVDYWRSATQSLLAYPGEGESADNALKAYSKDVNATANLLAAHNFTAQAEEAYQLALQVYPSSPEAVTGLAQVMAQTGRADQAKALLDQFAAKYPQQRAAIQQAGWKVTWTPK